jgi:hypothetical protein
LKIAFDEHVPTAMVRALEAFAKERQLRRITGDIEIKSAKDYAPQPGDTDYLRKNDAPWLKRFAADGGKVVISGDTKMRWVPHERLALIEHDFVVIFFENQWSKWKFFRKCALLLHWWPLVASCIKRAKPGFWYIPCHWKEKGRLRKVSTDDPRKLKIERKQVAARKKRQKTKVAPKEPPMDLFRYADAKKNNRRTGKTEEDKA